MHTDSTMYNHNNYNEEEEGMREEKIQTVCVVFLLKIVAHQQGLKNVKKKTNIADTAK